MRPLRQLVPVLAVCLFCLPYMTMAQLALETTPSAPKSSPVMVDSEPRWADLSETQKNALAPLRDTWAVLSQGHRRKWIALSQNYPLMAENEQEKLQARMVDWAALSPKDREQARLNFAQAKKLPTQERTANWEAYQALSEEEKKALLEAASFPPRGAAVAVKPMAPNKLTAVPVTRKTPEPEKTAGPKTQTLDPYTLLPQTTNTKENLRLN